MKEDIEVSDRHEAMKQQINTLRRAFGLLIDDDPEMTFPELERAVKEFRNDISTDEVVVPNNGDPDGKRQAIFDFALRKWKEQRRKGDGVALTYEMIQAAADCSKAWAYEIMADMADEYEQCHYDEDPIRLKIDGLLLNEYDSNYSSV